MKHVIQKLLNRFKSERDYNAFCPQSRNPQNMPHSQSCSSFTEKCPSLTEKGRSLTEMLGVLAVIGVLTVASLVGYTYAINKFKTNDLIEELNRRSLALSAQILSAAVSLDQQEFGDKTRQGYVVRSFILNSDPSYFEINVMHIPTKVCKMLLGSGWNVPILIYANDKVYTNNDYVCGEADEASMRFIFSADLLGDGSPLLPCEGNDDCGKCETCTDNKCQNPKGYIYYYGQCVVGNPCGDEAVWDEEAQKCRCPSGQVFVRDRCELFVNCPAGAKWDDAMQMCVCTDPTMTYDELTKSCLPNTCKSGEWPTRFWGLRQWQSIPEWISKCCPLGQESAQYNENGQESAIGFCCKKGYISVREKEEAPDSSGTPNTYRTSFCVANYCPEDQPTSFYTGDIEVPICCPKGITAAARFGADQKEYRAGVCCPKGYTVYKNEYSYCVPETCPSDTPERITYMRTNGGGGRPFRDDVPICCPKDVTVAAKCNEAGVCVGGGQCCQPGSEVVNTNGTTRCSMQSCPASEHIVQYYVNYGLVNKCCPLDVKVAAVQDSDLVFYKEGVCCKPNEKRVDTGSGSFCSPAECSADKPVELHYKVESVLTLKCCPIGTKAAANYSSSGSGDVRGMCCAPDESSNLSSIWMGSICMKDTCPAGQNKLSFYLGTKDQGPAEYTRCCPENVTAAALYNSSGISNSRLQMGQCCAQGEQSYRGYKGSVCAPLSCGGSTRRMTLTVDGFSVPKCCPLSTKAVAMTSVQNVVNDAGVCCGPTEIVVNPTKSNSRCQACPVGLQPNDSGTKCI